MSNTVKWKDEFLLGIDAIDSQHKTIFEHLLALENSIDKRDPWHIVQYFLAEIRESLKFHLAVEDALLEILAYPDLEKHRTTHNRLIGGVGDMERRVKDAVVNKSCSSEPLVGFFEQWFVSHVLSDDLEYTDYVKRCWISAKVVSPK